MTKSILVIDDDPDMLRLARNWLGDEGFSVDIALGGKEGVDHFAQVPADLVITDIFMPGHSGFTVIQEMMRLSQTVRIVACSGGDEGVGMGSFVLKEAEKIGARATLAKPFTREALLTAVHEALDDQ